MELNDAPRLDKDFSGLSGLLAVRTLLCLPVPLRFGGLPLPPLPPGGGG